MTVSQQNRLLAVTTPLGRDVLLLGRFEGTEGISRLFEFRLQMISRHHNLAFERIIGHTVTVTLVLANGQRRFFHGYVSSFGQGGGSEESAQDLRYSHYQATVVPWLWMLTQTTNCRIFQGLNVPDIVEQVFQDHGYFDYSFRLRSRSYPVRNYCVQYRESDFNFISRLLEDEGIYYFFEHEENKHTLVLADNPDEHRPCPHFPSVRYRRDAGARMEEDMILSLERAQNITIGKYTVTDFNFEAPTTNLEVEVSSRYHLGPGEREFYQWPGGYLRRPDGDRIANLRMQEREARITTIRGTGNCRAFATGYRFELTRHYRSDWNNQDYVLTKVVHSASQGGSYPGVEPDPDLFSYSNSFECIPHAVPYRPPLRTPKPVVRGCQTAVVVGPVGEEIYTDRYGRVKVRFYWDREHGVNDDSSCWMRVSHPWAGAGWGCVAIPRIGQEVIVDFLEGDPDRPIITGRVYHGHNMPPYDLPAGGVISGMKSNTTPGGGGFNEISMDDTKGREKITIHGQYDMSTTVEHDYTLTVNNDSTTTVVRNRTTSVKAGNDSLTVKAGKREVSVQGDAKLTVQAGGRTVTVSSGKYETTAAQGVKLTGNGKGIELTGNGGPGVKIHGAPNVDAIGDSKVTISSPNVDVGNKVVKIHGSKIEISASGGKIVIDGSGVTISGSKIESKTGGTHVIKGSPVQIN